MKTKTFKVTLTLTVFALVAALHGRSSTEALDVSENVEAGFPSAQHSTPIPPDQIGAVAGKQYSGDGLSVVATDGGALLRCVFQRIEGRATKEGLWLRSSVEDAKGVPFRVKAVAMERETANGTARLQMTPIGSVNVADKVVRYVRSSVTEEYSVSMDGVRQDFVIHERPAGEGQLGVELEVAGAKVEPLVEGARLVLEDGGRRIVYCRLKATDAQGSQLRASMLMRTADRLVVLLDDAHAVYPVRIDPTFSDANWIRLNPSIPGANNTIFTAAADGSGNLYIGGDFTVVGDVIAHRVAKWNGNTWSALGAGVNNRVNALVVSGSDLYVGGQFTIATNGNGLAVSINRVARWNGSTWSALGVGVNNLVYTLAVAGTNLYVGGYFTTAGGSSAYGIARWNGSSWSALGAGLNNYVYALAVAGSDLYAGGSFTTAGGSIAYRVAKWNGTSWSALGGGVDSLNSSVYALAVAGSDLYLGGQFTSVGGTAVKNVAKWNGSSWSALGAGLNGSVRALAVSETNLYVGGYFTTAGGSSASRVARWNGSNWSTLGAGVGSGVYALAMWGNDLYAGGNFWTAGGSSANCVARWNGGTWSAVGAGLGFYVHALALAGDSLYVGGSFTVSGGGPANHITRWDGSGWSSLGVGVDGDVDALAVSGSSLYAGGWFTSAGGTAAKYVAQWDGRNWSALAAGVNYYVKALAVVGGDLYIGGQFTYSGTTPVNYLAKWNGSSWSAAGTGLNNGARALAVSGTNLYVGGAFTDAGGIAANYVAKWDGSNWSALGGGMDNEVSALAVSGSELYVGGYFTAATNDGGLSVPANYVAKWGGSSWSALESGVDGYVYALAVSGSALYVGGYFTTAGGTVANYVAQWDGSSWWPLGSGANGIVTALAVAGSSLYIGGEFTMVGGKVSAYVAQANLEETPQIPSPITLGSATISNEFFSFRFTNTPGATFTVLATTNLSLPSSNWTVLGGATEVSPGWFQFADPQATNKPKRFYRVRSPLFL